MATPPIMRQVIKIEKLYAQLVSKHETANRTVERASIFLPRKRSLIPPAKMELDKQLLRPQLLAQPMSCSEAR